MEYKHVTRLAAVSLVVGGLAAASVTCAFAMESAQEFMKAVNTNSDNTLSMKEVNDYAAKRFEALDTDKDGKLDMQELKGHISESDFKAANTSVQSEKDPTLSKKEFMAYVDHLFTVANVNVTGGKNPGVDTLTEKELQTPAGQNLIALLEPGS